MTSSLEQQLQALVRLLDTEKIKYAILGGMAVAIYGEPRFTADIDINVILEKDRVKEFLARAKEHGFYPAFPNIQRIIEKTGVMPMHFTAAKITGRVDIIIAENLLEYTAIKRSKLKKISCIKARIISPEDLIIHKMASSRPRDSEDAKSILIRQKGRLDLKYIKYWLKKLDRLDKTFCLSKSFDRLLKVA